MLKIKRSVAGVIAAIFLLSGLLVLAEDTEAGDPLPIRLEFYYGDRGVALENVLLEDEGVLLPLRELLSAFGYGVDWDAQKGEVVAEIAGRVVRAKPNSRIFTIDDLGLTAPVGIVKRESSCYIPLNVLTEGLGFDISYDAEAGRLDVWGLPDTTRLGTPESLFPSSEVYATTSAKASLYTSVDGRIKGALEQDTQVEVLADKGYKWYNVKTTQGETGWLKAEALNIDALYEVNPDSPTEEEIQTYLELKQLDSPTKYLVWVDIDRQQVYVLERENDGFKLFKRMKCSSGSNKSPTIRGTFTVKKDRGYYFYSQASSSGAKYWVRFDGLYLFHSIALDKNMNILDPTLGERVSAGCVRLSMEDSEWIYRNLPEGTTVYIN